MKKIIVVVLIVAFMAVLVLSMPDLASSYYSCQAIGCPTQKPVPTVIRPTPTQPPTYWCDALTCYRIPPKR